MGALFLSNPSAKVSNSTFIGNTADDGAGIYFNCSLALNCSLEIEDSVFANGLASKTGGAIKWSLVRPKVVNCSFSNNSAVLYGDHNASFPIEVKMIDKAFRPSDNYSVSQFRSG